LIHEQTAGKLPPLLPLWVEDKVELYTARLHVDFRVVEMGIVTVNTAFLYGST